MSKQNMTLLSQREIDTLVEFLRREKDVDSDVLNQQNIDKLIRLVHAHQERFYRVSLFALSAEEGWEALRDFYTQWNVDTSKAKEFELQMKEAEQVELWIVDGSGEPVTPIVPEQLTDLSFQGESHGWGSCIMPAVFVQVAEYFRLNYTEEMMEKVCERYALTMYGNKEAEIPELFLAG